jgi:hypothetical protein
MPPGCWPWSPGRTWSRPGTPTGPTGGGGSPGAQLRTGWCLSSIPARGTSTRTARATRKASKGTCPSSPGPGCSPPSRSPEAAARAITRPLSLPALLDGEEGKLTILGDTAYGTGDLREHLQAGGHAAVIKPPPLRQVIPGGFTIDDFTVDDQAGTVTCPAGHTITPGRPRASGSRQAQFKALCRGCPLRERCTTSRTGRVLTVHPQHALLAAARRAAADPAWKDEYRRWRPPVERATAWLVAHGSRRVPCPLRSTTTHSPSPGHHRREFRPGRGSTESWAGPRIVCTPARSAPLFPASSCQHWLRWLRACGRWRRRRVSGGRGWPGRATAGGAPGRGR